MKNYPRHSTVEVHTNTAYCGKYCDLLSFVKRKQMRQDFIHIRLSKLDPAVVGLGLKWAGVRLESATSFTERVPGS